MKPSCIILLTTSLSAYAAPGPLQARQTAWQQDIQELIQGATQFPGDFLSGNFAGVANDLGLLVEGASSFAGDFLSDPIRRSESDSPVLFTVKTRDVQARQTAWQQDIQQMITGATQFSPDFLSGNFAGVANDLGMMVDGATSFPGDFLTDPIRRSERRQSDPIAVMVINAINQTANSLKDAQAKFAAAHPDLAS